jgi:hypothetical protein
MYIINSHKGDGRKSRRMSALKSKEAPESFSKEIAAEINKVRSNPTAYSLLLQQRLSQFEDEFIYLPHEDVRIQTKEGKKCKKHAT